jgi:hypothetical protein
VKKALIGRILVTIAGVIALANFVLIFNLFPVTDYIKNDWITHPLTGISVALLLSIPGVVLLHMAKKAEGRGRLDWVALVSGWLLISIALLVWGGVFLWILLFNL